MLFAALSGPSAAAVVAIGSILTSGMIAAGYDKRFAVGVIATSGLMGIPVDPDDRLRGHGRRVGGKGVHRRHYPVHRGRDLPGHRHPDRRASPENAA